MTPIEYAIITVVFMLFIVLILRWIREIVIDQKSIEILKEKEPKQRIISLKVGDVEVSLNDELPDSQDRALKLISILVEKYHNNKTSSEEIYS